MTNTSDTAAPRALTMRPPWGTAIARLGKNIENRTWGTAYRGPLLIHQGQTWSEHGVHDPRVLATWKELTGEELEAIHPASMPTRAAVAVANLVDVHKVGPKDTCCQPWGDRLHDDLEGHEQRYRMVHWVLEDVRPLDVPVVCNGAQGLWTPRPELVAEVYRRLAEQDPPPRQRRSPRHPADVTADRLTKHYEEHYETMTGRERDDMGVTITVLREVAGGLR